MSGLPEWANWIARNDDGNLFAFKRKPSRGKEGVLSGWLFGGECAYISEVDSTYAHVKWTDEEPTSVATLSKTETVNHPDHYQGNKYEAIDIIEDYNLNFHLGNVIKYVLRADKKNNRVEDLKKAAWYLNREMEREEG